MSWQGGKGADEIVCKIGSRWDFMASNGLWFYFSFRYRFRWEGVYKGPQRHAKDHAYDDSTCKLIRPRSSTTYSTCPRTYTKRSKRHHRRKGLCVPTNKLDNPSIYLSFFTPLITPTSSLSIFLIVLELS